MAWFRTKAPRPVGADSELRRTLSSFDLIMLGIGAIIGAGVFVLTGVAAATHAGPGITLSYVISGTAAMLAALSYAELATSVGGCGSAYDYAYTGLGEVIAWVIGWNLLFEYTLAISTVAIGWSGYVNDLLFTFGISFPDYLQKSPQEGGLFNLPAVLIISVLTILLCIGVKQSARFNNIIVGIKLLTIGLFILVAVNHVQPHLWHPYFPFGWHGVISGAALVFYAYIGFDALSTATEETKNPQKSIPIGIIGSLIVCSIIYVVISALLTGIVPYADLNVKSPVANALILINYPKIASVISLGAIAGLTTVMLVMFYGLTRIVFAISRDHLLPNIFATISPKTQTPILSICVCGVIIAIIAGTLPLNEAAELVNIGTLTAFVFVCAGVMVLRIRYPNLNRPFKLPLNPVIPLLGILFCSYLMLNLPLITWIRFVVWLVLGLIIYTFYSRKMSLLHHDKSNSDDSNLSP